MTKQVGQTHPGIRLPEMEAAQVPGIEELLVLLTELRRHIADVVDTNSLAPDTGGNLFINSMMNIDQRETNGSAVTVSGISTTLTATSAATDTTLTVDWITGISDGDPIDVTLDDNTHHRTTVNGAPSGSTVTITDGVPSQAGSGNIVSTAVRIFGPDCWYGVADGTGDFTIEQEDVASGSRFGGGHSLKLTVTSTDTPGAGEAYYFGQVIEGFDSSHLMWGEGHDEDLIDPQVITIRFVIKSSVAGTYCLAINNHETPRPNGYYVEEFEIDTADTWEKKEIRIEGNPNDDAAKQIAWILDGNIAINVSICLGCGTDFETTTIEDWVDQGATYGRFLGTADQVNWIANSGATLEISDLRFMIGDVSRDNGLVPYHQDLAACQRRFNRIKANSRVIGGGSTRTANNWEGFIPLSQEMRAAPTIVGSLEALVGGTIYALTSLTNIVVVPGGIVFTATATGAGANTAGGLGCTGTNLDLNAELDGAN